MNQSQNNQQKNLNLFFYGNDYNVLSSNCHGCYHYGYICPGSVQANGECGAWLLTFKEVVGVQLASAILKKYNQNPFVLARVMYEDDVDFNELMDEEDLENFAEKLSEAQAISLDEIHKVREMFNTEEYFFSTNQELESEKAFKEKDINEAIGKVVNDYFNDQSAFDLLRGLLTLEDYNRISDEEWEQSKVADMKKEMPLQLFSNPFWEESEIEPEEKFGEYKPTINGESMQNSNFDEDPFATSYNERKQEILKDDLPF